MVTGILKRSARHLLLLPLALPALGQALSLRDAVESAWRFNPDTVQEASGVAGAAAGQSVAASWLAGAPSVVLAERNDRFDANAGRRVQELELALPFRRPGQREAHSARADADAELAATLLAEARWKVAGEVREAAWSAALDANDEAFMQRRFEVTERIGREVARHVEVGDLARADWLLVEGEKLAAQTARLEAARRAEESLRHYQAMIGLADAGLPDGIGSVARPTFAGDSATLQPPLPVIPGAAMAALPPFRPVAGGAPAVALEDAHPLLRRAEAEVRRAARGVNEAAQSADAPLELSLGLERERESHGQPVVGSVRLGLRIPFGGSTWNRPALAAAGASKSRAELAQGASRRAVAATIANATAARTAAEMSLRLAEQRRQGAEEHARLLRKGFALGETGLAALLRGESLLLDAEAAVARHHIAVGQALSRLEHSLGILP